MLKLAVFLLAALAGPCLAQYELNYISKDPHILSHYKGHETCSYSSPAWLQSFFSNRISIESVFSDVVDGEQNPTIQSSFRITFNRPGTPLLTETYVAPDPSIGFSSTFVSGATTTGWVDILYSTPTDVLIIDWNTGSLIQGISDGTLFEVYLFAPTWFFERGRGLLVQGCPYKDVYPYQTYNQNPNWGRRKRQVEIDESTLKECENVAKLYEKNFPQFKSLNAETILSICKFDSAFIKGTAQSLLQNIEILQRAVEALEKNFPKDYIPVAMKDEFKRVVRK